MEMVVKVAFFQMALGMSAAFPCFSRRFIQKMKAGTKTALMARKAMGRAWVMFSTSAESML